MKKDFITVNDFTKEEHVKLFSDMAKAAAKAELEIVLDKMGICC